MLGFYSEPFSYAKTTYSLLIMLPLVIFDVSAERINRFTFQNELGADFVSTLSLLETDEVLVRELLFSQNQLEFNIFIDGSNTLCQGLLPSNGLCPFSEETSVSLFGEESRREPSCQFMSNPEASCLLAVQEKAIKVFKRTEGGSLLESISISVCKSSLCAEKQILEIPFRTECPTTTSQKLRSLPFSIMLAQEMYVSNFDASMEKALIFFEEEVSLINLVLIALFRTTLTLLDLSVDNIDLCTSQQLPSLSSEAALTLVFDNCVAEISFPSRGELCVDAISFVHLQNITSPFLKIIERSLTIINDGNCDAFDSCSPAFERSNSVCGNGILEEGEECECPPNLESCDCCSRCVLKREALCDGLNNDCCGVDCTFKSVENMCTLDSSSKSGYCRLGQCEEGSCTALGYNSFCGLSDNNPCKTKCEIGEQECVDVDPSNPSLFVRDGAICPLSRSKFGVCESGNCVSVAGPAGDGGGSGELFPNMYVILGFTGFGVLIGLVVILFAQCKGSSGHGIAHYDAQMPVNQLQRRASGITNPAFTDASPLQQQPNIKQSQASVVSHQTYGRNSSFTAQSNLSAGNNHQGHRAGSVPLMQHSSRRQAEQTQIMPTSRKAARKSKRWLKKQEKEVEVVNTPHRSSVGWANEHKGEVFSVHDSRTSTGTLSRTGSQHSMHSMTKQSKRVSARSADAPPGLGWRAAAGAPGEEYTFYKS